jgi:membrane protease YdiL (CAAX protease family)
VAWTSAAFGEEIVFRAGLQGWLSRRFGGQRVGGLAALLVASIVFGAGHAYQGMLGALLAGCAGLVYGALFLRARGRLWSSVLAHGLYDTTGFVILFLGVSGMS